MPRFTLGQLAEYRQGLLILAARRRVAEATRIYRLRRKAAQVIQGAFRRRYLTGTRRFRQQTVKGVRSFTNHSYRRLGR